MVTYEELGTINRSELQKLFLDLEWQSGYYKEYLYHAIKNSNYYITARNSKNELIGLINALDDGAINAYIPYALVHPDYQHQGIGKQMIELLKSHYKDYLRISLISYKESIPFYLANDFSICIEQSPMELSKFPKMQF